MEENFNDTSFLLNDKNILSLHKYKYIVTFIILVIFVITACFFIYHYPIVVSFFEFFEKSEMIKQIIKNKLETPFKLQDFTFFLTLLFIYFYWFRYLEKKGIMAYVDETKEGKYFSFLFPFLSFFNLILFLPLLLYLLCLKQAWIEFFCILASYIIGKLVFLNLLQSYQALISNYYLLDKWYRINKAYKLKLPRFDKQAKLSPQFVRNIKADSNKSMFNDIITSMKWFVVLDIKSELKYIFVISIFTTIIGIFAEFNLISIIYLFLNYILWYSILSIFLRIPKKAKTITLTTGKKICYVDRKSVVWERVLPAV